MLSDFESDSLKDADNGKREAAVGRMKRIGHSLATEIGTGTSSPILHLQGIFICITHAIVFRRRRAMAPGTRYRLRGTRLERLSAALKKLAPQRVVRSRRKLSTCRSISLPGEHRKLNSYHFFVSLHLSLCLSSSPLERVRVSALPLIAAAHSQTVWELYLERKIFSSNC